MESVWREIKGCLLRPGKKNNIPAVFFPFPKSPMEITQMKRFELVYDLEGMTD